MEKTKIVLDADVIIHFSKGGLLSLLPRIFPNYKYIILSNVYCEIEKDGKMKRQLDNQINYLRNIEVIDFKPAGHMLMEFANLIKTMGSGESASLAYCRFENDVIGSSNLSDIKKYCTRHGITYLTTFDFLYHAVCKKMITMKEAVDFIDVVNSNGSTLPSSSDFSTFVSTAII